LISAGVQIVVLSLPAAVFAWRRRSSDARKVLGLTLGKPTDYWLAVVVTALVGAVSLLATRSIPADVLAAAGSANRITSLAAGAAVLLRATSEELLFRGFLQGVIGARFGRSVGVWTQAVLFLLPHLLLLALSPLLWPLLPAQFLAGLCLGWLRSRHDSIAPPILAHGVTNLLAGLTI